MGITGSVRVVIRSETSDDVSAIAEVTAAAFKTLAISKQTEQFIIAALRAAQAAIYREYAERHQLLTSAGSDSHGPGKPPIKYRAELSHGLLERVGIQMDAGEQHPASLEIRPRKGGRYVER